MMSQTEDQAQENQAVDNPATENELRAELGALKASLSIRDASIDSLKKKLSEYESKVAEIREFVKKMEQETSAIRDRAKRDLEKNVQSKSAEFLRNFLPLMDNFQRSLESVKSDSTPFVEGIRLVRRELEDVLKSAGLKRIPTVGEVFDPQIHEAVASEPCEEDQDGRITRELRSGFQMGDLVVRVAQVLVGKKS
jgi:molecular chaperone GrpE